MAHTWVRPYQEYIALEELRAIDGDTVLILKTSLTLGYTTRRPHGKRLNL
jgi:hypothetical protein